MEALGVASGVAGLLSLTEFIVTKGHKYCTRYKSARADIKEFLAEMQRLHDVLSRLRLLAICLESDEPEVAQGVTAARLETFHSSCKNLYELKMSLATMDFDSKKGKLEWPFKATETKDMVLKIGRNRDDLSTALTADGLTAMITALKSGKETLNTMREGVVNIQDTMRATADELIRKETDETKMKVYKWCSPSNPYDKHEASKAFRFPETVVWIFECDEYKSWISNDNSSLWLHGIRNSALSRTFRDNC
ncbi:hypothetical protein VTL71DRAFT_12008 [Oculimacula yallundae]|uniref:Fungal N-terminal domain-containing protein n=1 Tax=Oculimacula yallundae TaxID=86028 RepID=A0ABR4CRU0_9HELO